MWLEDPGVAWVDGTVVKINGQDAEIETTNGKKVIFTCNFDSNAAYHSVRPTYSFNLHVSGCREYVKTVSERYGGTCWWGR